MELKFVVKGENIDFEVYIMCLDILMGVIYVGIVVGYFLVIKVVVNNLVFVVFIDECKNIKVVEVEIVIMEKKGMVIGLMVIYFFNGCEVFIYIVNFVLMDYGIGVVMVVFVYD